MTRSNLLAIGLLLTTIAGSQGALAAGGGAGGYIDLSLGALSGSDHKTDTINSADENWLEGDVLGDAEVAMPVGADFALQLGAYVDSWRGNETCTGFCGSNNFDYSGRHYGGAAHFAYKMDGGTLGGMVSVGELVHDNEDSAGWGTIAGEASATMDAVRFYGQVGYTRGLTDGAGQYNSQSLYATGVVSYFFDPNLSLSADAGISRYHTDFDDYSELDVSWGAQLEKKLDNSPVSVYVGYNGFYWSGADGTDPYQANGLSNGILIGARVALGGADGTLKDRATTAGLLDLNPIYGAVPH